MPPCALMHKGPTVPAIRTTVLKQGPAGGEMALPLVGEPVGIQEKIELITYSPNVADSGDMETATKTITATAEASGLVNADYSVGLTLLAPSDARLAVLRIAARLAVTVDSMTAGTLSCRVYVDAQQADRRLLDLSWTSAGAKATAVSTHSANLATIFSLLKNGAAHTFYFFFWVNAGNAVISLCELWEGPGTDGGSSGHVLSLTHRGLVTAAANQQRVGTGSVNGVFTLGGFNAGELRYKAGNMNFDSLTALISDTLYFDQGGTVASDITYVESIYIVLRSIQ